MNTNLNWLPFLLLVLFFSCSPSQREKAVAKMNVANELVISGDTLQAISMLESVEQLFPKAEVQIQVAKNLADDLYRQMIDSRMSSLKGLENQIELYEANFIKEKTEFDLYTQYIPKKLTFNRSWDKSFLQVHLDERGEMYLTSHYMGRDWLAHTSIRVYDGDISMRSSEVSLDDPNNRKSDFLDHKWEKVSYTNNKSDSLIAFIALNSERKLKCAFLGKRNYYIILEPFNIEAIKSAYDLSLAIHMRNEIRKEIEQLEQSRKK
jgi:hypothetical protein